MKQVALICPSLQNYGPSNLDIFHFDTFPASHIQIGFIILVWDRAQLSYSQCLICPSGDRASTVLEL